jgi:hypothetical protein
MRSRIRLAQLSLTSAVERTLGSRASRAIGCRSDCRAVKSASYPRARLNNDDEFWFPSWSIIETRTRRTLVLWRARDFPFGRTIYSVTPNRCLQSITSDQGQNFLAAGVHRRRRSCPRFHPLIHFGRCCAGLGLPQNPMICSSLNRLPFVRPLSDGLYF